jgi:P2-related tail formation protein
MGAGITTVPVPQRLLMLPLMNSTLGKPLLSWSFSVHFGLAFGITFPKKESTWRGYQFFYCTTVALLGVA